MRSTLSLAGAGCAVVLWGLLATPASAYKWPGEGASPGSVVWTKVIGQKCSGVFTAAEMAELDAYLAKARSEWAADRSLADMSFDRLVTELSANYAGDYPRKCNEDAEGAQEMLQRVRAVMATGRPVLGRG